MGLFSKKDKKKKETTLVEEQKTVKAADVRDAQTMHESKATPVQAPVSEQLVEQSPVTEPVTSKVRKEPVSSGLKSENGSDDGTGKNKPAKYHVSQNKDDKSEYFKQWRVRKEGSDKTIKYLKTQKEAIAYAEQLAGNSGSSIVIHKVDGSWRKQDYTKK